MRLRLGSRGSKLALWQAHHVAGLLRGAWRGLEVEITIIATEGDQRADAPLTAGSPGVFVKEIEAALLRETIDLGVHSMKDLPTEVPKGLAIAAVPPRHDPRDALVCSRARRIEDLPERALVATGSPRRRSQLAHARPDLRFTAVRGNVDTRLAKLARGEFDALVLAVAGIERLGLTEVPYAPIPVSLSLPAPGQGALALEIRAEDAASRDLVRRLDDAEAGSCVAAERSFLASLGAGCLAPAGAIATRAGDRLTIEAMVGTVDGRRQVRDRLAGPAADPIALGAALARRMLVAGGESILREARGAAGPAAP